MENLLHYVALIPILVFCIVVKRTLAKDRAERKKELYAKAKAVGQAKLKYDPFMQLWKS